jgi:tetratricopeptide (TPR) repeat protein
MGLVYAYDALGDLDSAERELSEGWDEALKTQYKTMARYWRSVLLLKSKSYDEARKSAVEFAALYEAEPNKKLVRCPLMLQGQIELENGSPAKAIELLSRAKSLEEYIDFYDNFPTIRVPIMDLLGSAYFRAGDMEKARLEYEEISRMTWPRDRYGDKYAKSFYHLGQIYERLGKKSKARENYRKFLDLWKDADPGLPEVEDAKKRLAGLKGS